MNKITNEDIRTMFAKQRAEAENSFEQKNITEKPTEPGKYNVSIQGVRSFAPMFLNFDGKNWIGLDELAKSNDVNLSDLSKISYYVSTKPKNKPKM